MFEMFSRCTLGFRRIRGVCGQPGKVRDMRTSKLTYLLPLVISLTTALEGYASLGLLSQSTVIATRALMRLRRKVRSNISGFGLKLPRRTHPVREWVGISGNSEAGHKLNALVAADIPDASISRAR
jgi:hypothetical protein